MTCQVPEAGEEKLQLSLLPVRYGRQSHCEVVGGEPRRTYRSASPEPPEIWNTRFVAPEGTSRVKRSSVPDEPDRSVTGTPFCSSPSPGPGPPPPPAAATAAAASTMPTPQPEQLAGKGRAVLFSRLSTPSGVSALFTLSTSAATPATCGAAMDVPW